MKSHASHLAVRLGFIMLLLNLLVGNTMAAPTAPNPNVDLEQMTVPAGPLKGMSIDDVLKTEYAELKASTGVELNLMQRFTLKRVQKRYEKLQKNPKKAVKFKERIAQSGTANPNKLGLIAMILGIVGIVLIWIPIVGILGFFALIAALVLGIIGLKRDEKPGKAIAGIVLGSVGVGLMILAFVAIASIY